ncbi:MAG: GNAT family N-acetyltransferase [Nocardioides sp.]
MDAVNGALLAKPEDARVVTGILVDAFADDPMWGAWAFPEPTTRRANREAVFRILVDGALAHPCSWLSGDRTATSLWIPPGASEMSAEQEAEIDELLQTSLGAGVGAVLSAFERFDEARPDEDHHYLTLLGTDPAHQGRGTGGRLLAANLERLDGQHAAAYLEAADELVPFYARFGFEHRSRIALEDGPTVNGMWRDPR